jgi:hypothetical protein
MTRLRGLSPRRQRGLAAIEFALVFPIFVLLFYGLVNGGVILTVQQGLHFAAQNAARAALTADPEGVEYQDYINKIEELAQDQVEASLAWMPSSWTDRLLETVTVDSPDDALGGTPEAEGVERVTVVIAYPYATAPILPRLDFGGAKFPPVPATLAGQATLRL